MDAINFVREFISLPIGQAMIGLAAMVIIVLYNISKNTREQTKLMAKMVHATTQMAENRAESAESQKTDLEGRIEKIEARRDADKKGYEEQRCISDAKIQQLETDMAALKAELRAVASERDRLIAHQEKLISVSNEALETLGKIREEVIQGQKQRQALMDKIKQKEQTLLEKDAIIRQKDERITDLLTQIEGITAQMTILRKRIQELEKKPDSIESKEEEKHETNKDYSADHPGVGGLRPASAD